MEIGQKIIQTNNNITAKINELSIQVSLSGLSFFIRNSQTRKTELIELIGFDKKRNPSEVLDQIKHLFNTNTSLNQAFSKIIVIHDNELMGLVPEALFDNTHLADYLKFNTKILQTDYITHESLEMCPAEMVYVPFVNINNYIFERFGNFEYKHAATIFIDSVLKLKRDNNVVVVYVNVGNTHFEVVVIKNNHILFFNRFDYTSPEDFIYYILFTYEQLELDAEKIPIIFTGQINENDDIYAIVYRYIRHVSLLDSTDENETKKSLKNYILTRSL